MSYKSYKAWKERNPEKAKALNKIYSARWHKKHPEARRAREAYRYWTKEYGITPEFRAQIWETQGKRCKICNKETSKPQLDHCHKTKQIRGMLCITCNTTLGKFNDDPAMFRKIAEYLEKEGTK